MAKKETELTGVKEIARRANISIGTVDRVLNNRTGVARGTREKILAIIKEMNYEPNLLGRRLASNKVTKFAALLPEVSSETSFWEAPLKGIEQAETEIRQYNVRIEKYFYDQDDKNSFVTQAKKILKSRPEGILIAPSFIDESVEFTNRLRKLNIPYVFFDSDLPDQPSLSYIGPELYRSGYLAANLISLMLKKNDNVLIVNISKEMENHHHLLRKEEGFRGYFTEQGIPNTISKIDVRNVNYSAVEKAIQLALKKNPATRLIFVTNSRVSAVARYLKASGKQIILVGYDYLKENIKYLEEDVIKFLICQKPGDQAYKGIMTLYKHIVLKLPVDQNVYMPIDVIMKGNYSFYSN